MLGHKARGQTELVFAGSIAAFVPDDHVLVRVDRVLDLSWLPGEVADCYSPDQGRPGIDPEVAVRLMLAGLLLGLVHDRKLMREAQVNLAIRWFAGFGLLDKVPDHSSLTRIRQRWGPERFRRIFEKTVEACVAARLVAGDMLHVDATLVRADVSWSSLAVQYVEAVEAANEPASENSGAPGDPPPSGTSSAKSERPKRQKRSRSDPDARMATNKYNQRLEPCYKQLTGVDSRYGITVDVAVVRADTHEGATLHGQIDRVEALTGFKVAAVTADKAYGSAANFDAAEKRGVYTVIPTQRPRRSRVPLSRFRHDEKHDVLRCPEGRPLKPGARTAHGRLYRARAKDCRNCRLAADCLPPKAKARSIIIQDGYSALLRARRRRLKKLRRDKDAYASHRFRVEGVHGEAKACHGLRRAMRRGLDNVSIQSWLTAVAINLKRLAKALFRHSFGPNRGTYVLSDAAGAIKPVLSRLMTSFLASIPVPAMAR